jgi:hypothetical protein
MPILNEAEKSLLASYGIYNCKKLNDKIKKILKLFRPQLIEEQKRYDNNKLTYKKEKGEK